MANFALFCGRTTKEPEIRYTQSSEPMCVARFSLAVDRVGRNKGADFPNMVAFGKTGEFVEKYVKKGTKLVVRCHYQSGNYTNRDGQKVYTHDFVVDEIEFAESKAAQEQNTQNSQPQTQTQNAQPQTTQPQNNIPTVRTYDDFMNNIPDTIDESVPFM